MIQPNAAGSLAPPAERGERVRERVSRSQSVRTQINMHLENSAPPLPSPLPQYNWRRGSKNGGPTMDFKPRNRNSKGQFGPIYWAVPDLFHFAFGLKGQQTSIDLRPLRRTAEPIGNQTGGAAGVWIGLMTPGLAGMGTATGVAWGGGNPVFSTGSRCEDFIPNGSNPGIFC